MPVNSRNKGACGEREGAALLRAFGFPAHRGRQYSGGPESPDIVSPTLPIHWELKRGKAFRPENALAQAERDSADTDVIPVALCRYDRGQWFVSLRAGWFLELLALVKRYAPKEALQALLKRREDLDRNIPQSLPGYSVRHGSDGGGSEARLDD